MGARKNFAGEVVGKKGPHKDKMAPISRKSREKRPTHGVEGPPPPAPSEKM